MATLQVGNLFPTDTTCTAGVNCDLLNSVRVLPDNTTHIPSDRFGPEFQVTEGECYVG